MSRFLSLAEPPSGQTSTSAEEEKRWEHMRAGKWGRRNVPCGDRCLLYEINYKVINSKINYVFLPAGSTRREPPEGNYNSHDAPVRQGGLGAEPIRQGVVKRWPMGRRLAAVGVWIWKGAAAGLPLGREARALAADLGPLRLVRVAVSFGGRRGLRDAFLCPPAAPRREGRGAAASRGRTAIRELRG